MSKKTDLLLSKQLLELQDRLSRETAPFKDVSPEGIKKRYRETLHDTDAWGKLYMPHYFDSPTPSFHVDIDAALDYPEKVVFVLHGPREHAKSARARIKLLKNILNGQVKYWLFGSEKLSLSWDHIDYLFIEMVDNRYITSDYDITVQQRNEQKGKLRFRVLNKSTGKIHTVLLEAVSYETQVKGKLFMNLRPQGATIDDLENTRSAKNASTGAEKWTWVLQELFGAVTGPVLWLGNIGRETSAMYQAMLECFDNNQEKFKKFAKNGSVPGQFALLCNYGNGRHEDIENKDVKIFPLHYRADRTGESGHVHYLWPERFPESWYKNTEATLGYRYQGEFNGVPKKPGKIFSSDQIGNYTNLPESAVWFTWLDMAWGRSTHSAYKSWIIGCYDGKYFYMVEAYCKQGTSAVDVIDRWYEAFERWNEAGLRDGQYEGTFAQDERFENDLFEAELRHGYRLPVWPDSNPGEKFARIESMEGTWNTGRILWAEQRTKDMDTVIGQALDFPDGDYVDGPDALEALINRLRKRFSTGKQTYESLGKRRTAYTKRR